MKTLRLCMSEKLLDSVLCCVALPGTTNAPGIISFLQHTLQRHGEFVIVRHPNSNPAFCPQAQSCRFGTYISTPGMCPA
jgi:hypothetical protein